MILLLHACVRYNEVMSNPTSHPTISQYGIGTTGFWSGRNQGLCDCIQTAIREYGVTVLDTAEMYGSGRCEEALGKAISVFPREQLFLVDKILPSNVTEKRFRECLKNSLIRLGTDAVDLYLLHWREDADLEVLVREMEQARADGLIRHWGVSNFDVEDLEDLMRVEHGNHCFCNQIFYNIYERGAEYELLPYMKAHDILPMSYSSLGSDYHPHPDIHKNEAVMKLCRDTGIAPEAYMLRMNAEMGFVTLFSTSSLSHLHANLKAIPDSAYAQFRELIDREFPAPDHRYPLVKI